MPHLDTSLETLMHRLYRLLYYRVSLYLTINLIRMPLILNPLMTSFPVAYRLKFGYVRVNYSEESV